MKVDFSKVKKQIGKKAQIASKSELIKTTGKDPGSVCIILLNNILPILIDHRVFDRNKIHFSSGNHGYGLEMMSSDLNQVLQFRVVDIAKVE